MRRISTIVAPAAVIALWAGLAFWSCEESLEACLPCDVVSGKNLTGLSGDPRLDATIWVANDVASRFEREWESYERDLEELAKVLSFPLSGARLTTRKGVASLAGHIEEVFFTGEPAVSVAYEPARCVVGSRAAGQAMLTCQRRLDCYVSDECGARLEGGDVDGICHGLCIGSCSGGCTGRCYAESKPEGGVCDGVCLGACLESNTVCPGLCIGGCAGEAASDALPCEEECAVGCLTRYGAECAGVCHGRCGVDSDGPCDGECRGSCDPAFDVCTGECRGQFRPVGCDEGLCDERSLVECREMSRLVGWGAMTCQSAHVALRDMQRQSLAAVRAQRALQIATLEQTLERVSKRQAFFSLLVDAFDISGQIDPEQLSESRYLASLGYPAPLIYLVSGEAPDLNDDERWESEDVPRDVVYYPLFSLMARLSYLAERSLGDGDYLVPEGVAGCLEPALVQALEGLRSIAPLTSASGVPEPDRQAPRSVYTLIDTQQLLLNLVSKDKPNRAR